MQRSMSSEKSEELQIKVTQLIQENGRLKQRSSSEVRNIYVRLLVFAFFVTWHTINNSTNVNLSTPLQGPDRTKA